MNTAESTAQDCEESLGQRLKIAREHAGLTEEVVAKKLNLRVCVIQALEKNDYDFGIPNTYIQGYLKNYARLVELPLDSIQPALNSLKIITPILKSAVKSEASIKSRFTKQSLTYLVVFMFITVLVLIWQTQTPKSKSSLSTSRDPQSTLMNAPQQDPAFLSKPEWAIDTP